MQKARSPDEIQWKKKEFMEQLAKSATSSIHEAICSEQHARLVLLREARKESAKIMLEKEIALAMIRHKFSFLFLHICMFKHYT